MSVKRKEIVLFLIVFNVAFATLSDKLDNEDPVMEVEEIFDEIDKCHNKLKKVVMDEVLKTEPNETNCLCVPFHLCDVTTGDVIRHGGPFLQSRISDENPCKDVQEICCERDSVNVSTRIQPEASFTPKCGYSYTKPTYSNDDPTSTAFGEHPWTVLILGLQEELQVYDCVGSLIHPQVVLTAAHCINETDRTLIARAGEYNIRAKDESISHKNKYVAKVIKHPKFQRDTLFYDAALLILVTEFQLAENINTVCLTKPSPNPLITRPQKCRTTGWGKFKPNGPYSGVMMKIPCLLVPHEQCQHQFRSTHLGRWFELHHSFVCAYGQNNVDVCERYGGAPLVCPIADESKRYQQMGIVSWGLDCGSGNPTVFTKIPQIKDWIDEQFDKLGFSKHYYTY